MALVFDSLTVTDWFHLVGRQGAAPVTREWSTAEATGREFVVLGSSVSDGSSLSVSFGEDGVWRNRIVGASAAAVNVIASGLETKLAAATVGSLSFGGETITQMRLKSFRRIGPVGVMVGSSTQYFQVFEAVWSRYVS